MTVRQTIRILKISLALAALLVFSTVVISSWHHHDSVNDAHCAYCHLGHQAAARPETGQRVAVLSPISFLPLPEDSGVAVSPVVSDASSRAPPLA